jgi:hypothetical protein
MKMLLHHEVLYSKYTSYAYQYREGWNLKLKAASKYYVKQNIHKIRTFLEKVLFQFYCIKCWSNNKQNRMMHLLKTLSRNEGIFSHLRSSESQSLDPDYAITIGPTKKEFFLPYNRLWKRARPQKSLKK